MFLKVINKKIYIMFLQDKYMKKPKLENDLMKSPLLRERFARTFIPEREYNFREESLIKKIIRVMGNYFSGKKQY